MKKILAILFLSTVVMVASLVLGVYIFLNFKGRAILCDKIYKNLGRKASVGSIKIDFPINLDIKNLEVEGLGKIDEVYITPSIVGILFGQTVLNQLKLVNPVVYISRGQDGKIEWPFAGRSYTGDGKSIKIAKTEFFWAVRNLKLINGQIIYSDNKIRQGGLEVRLKDLNIDIQNIFAIPYSVITKFLLTGSIPWPKPSSETGSVLFSGWIDLGKGDGKAQLSIKNIDAIYLYPYYDKYVTLEKTSIEKANLDFISNLVASNNNLVADCHLEIRDIIFKQKDLESQPPQISKRQISQVLDVFKNNEGKIVLDFSIKTHLRKPVFGIDSIRMAVTDKISSLKGLGPEQILRVPGKFVSSAFEGTTEISKAAISGVTGLGMVIKNTLFSAFKKESSGNAE